MLKSIKPKITRQNRWLITGVTTMLLTVAAFTDQAAFADTTPTNAETSQPTPPNNSLQQPNVSLNARPATAVKAPTTAKTPAPTQPRVSAPAINQSAPAQTTSSIPADPAPSTRRQSTTPIKRSATAAPSLTSTPQPTPTTASQPDSPITTAPASRPMTTPQTPAPRQLRARAATDDIDTWMPNQLLQAEVLRQLRAQNPGHTWNSAADITKDDMQLLTSYNGTTTYIDGQHDYSLAGLQYATNLTWLTLNKAMDQPLIHYYGDVTDLSPLANLTKLTTLNIRNNRVSDVSPLKGLVNLKTLWADFNHISDFSSLKSLTNLTELQYGNQVVVNLDPVLIDRNHPTYTLASQLHFKDGSLVPLQAKERVGEPVTLNMNNYKYAYKWYFNGATATTPDDNGGLTFTGLREQTEEWWSGTDGEYNGTTVVPVKDHYYLLGVYQAGSVYFAVVQAYELTDAAQPVTVKYQDQDGHSLVANDTVLNGMVGQPYTAPSRTFVNYRLVSTSGNVTGTFSATAQTVVFTYARMDAGNLLLKFQDENGQTLSADQTVSGAGQLGLDFDLPAPVLANYHTPANATGIFTTADQTYTFVYSRQDAADVTIQYQDENGTSLAADRVLSGTGQLGAEIPDQQRAIPGYTFKELITRAAGHFTAQPQTLIYVYTRDAGQNVTVKYVDTDGRPLHAETILTGALGASYTTEPLTIAGYALKTVTGAATGTFTDEPQIVTYVYQATTEPDGGGDKVDPEKPTKPTPPVDPTRPVQPTTKPAGGTEITTIIKPVAGQIDGQRAQAKPVTNEPTTLPQTSERPATAGIILSGLLTLLAALGLISESERFKR